MSLAIFYGSTTGNTEYAAEMISAELGDLVTHMANIVDSEPEDLLEYDVLLLGIPTWDYGELQYDWEDFLPQLKDKDFTGKKMAFFGMGDSYGYSDNFLDALGLLWDELKELGKPELVGLWPIEGYTFDSSKGQYDDEHFVGLGLDDENQSNMHEDRVRGWTTKLCQELGLSRDG